MTMTMTAKEILTPLQRRVLEFLFSDPWFRRYFYLTGGTALSAFYLEHRYSDDLDLFTHEKEVGPVQALFQELSSKERLQTIQRQKAPSFLRYEVSGELQVDIVADVEFRVGSPELISSFMVDSLKNIAVNKVTAILGRFDPKDFVDLYLLLSEKGFDIFELLELGKHKDAGLDLFAWSSLLESAERISILPRMIRDDISIAEIKAFFSSLRDELLDSIKPE
jgi:predicted nucleotidyltransferase component of viral defense system